MTNRKKSQFALDFLLEANLKSEETIGAVPEEFVTKSLQLIDRLNSSNKKLENAASDFQNVETYISEDNKITRIWKHKSVVRLMEESECDNPILEIRNRARKTVLVALENGWQGPPFNAIELAKLLKYEISPNDSIYDARTIAQKKETYLIEYNPFQKPTRMNFSIAHEIAHTLFSDCHEQIRNREEDPEENSELEQLCNIAAAELQLPYVVFPNDANSLDDINIPNLVLLAQKYKSSLESLFISLVQVIDRPCAILICTFQSENQLVIDYSKSSSSFKTKIPNKFVVPEESEAYHCATPGWSASETIKWPFLDKNHNIYCVGLSPNRKEKKGRVGIVIVPNDSNELLQNRKINIEFGDATKPRGKGTKIIAQVVNTSGGLGIGFGKALAKNYPSIKDELKKWKENKKEFRLGKSQLIQVSGDTYVFQMLAQNGLFTKDGKIPLEYTSLQQCLAELREHSLELNAKIYMPLIGAGQAKGDWTIIEGLIYSELVNNGVKVNIYILAGKVANFKPKSSLSLFNEQSTWQKEQ